jgi:hypothetical protein
LGVRSGPMGPSQRRFARSSVRRPLSFRAGPLLSPTPPVAVARVPKRCGAGWSTTAEGRLLLRFGSRRRSWDRPGCHRRALLPPAPAQQTAAVWAARVCGDSDVAVGSDEEGEEAAGGYGLQARKGVKRTSVARPARRRFPPPSPSRPFAEARHRAERCRLARCVGVRPKPRLP